MEKQHACLIQWTPQLQTVRVDLGRLLTGSSFPVGVIWTKSPLQNRDVGSRDCNVTGRICCFFVGWDSKRCTLDKTVTILQLLIDERTLEDIRYQWDCALVRLQLFQLRCTQANVVKKSDSHVLGFIKKGIIIQVNAHKGHGNLTSQMFLKLFQVPVLLFSKH